MTVDKNVSTKDEAVQIGGTQKKLKRVKLKKKKKKKEKCSQTKERKATQTLAIVLGESCS